MRIESDVLLQGNQVKVMADATDLTDAVTKQQVDAAIAAVTPIDLASEVTGVLPVTNGGTGLATLGSATQVLRVNSSGSALEYVDDVELFLSDDGRYLYRPKGPSGYVGSGAGGVRFEFPYANGFTDDITLKFVIEERYGPIDVYVYIGMYGSQTYTQYPPYANGNQGAAPQLLEVYIGYDSVNDVSWVTLYRPYNSRTYYYLREVRSNNLSSINAFKQGLWNAVVVSSPPSTYGYFYTDLGGVANRIAPNAKVLGDIITYPYTINQISEFADTYNAGMEIKRIRVPQAYFAGNQNYISGIGYLKLKAPASWSALGGSTVLIRITITSAYTNRPSFIILQVTPHNTGFYSGGYLRGFIISNDVYSYNKATVAFDSGTSTHYIYIGDGTESWDATWVALDLSYQRGAGNFVNSLGTLAKEWSMEIVSTISESTAYTTYLQPVNALWWNTSGDFLSIQGNKQLQLGNSTLASKPDLAFDGDGNTGLFSPAADALAITTGGTERLRVDNIQTHVQQNLKVDGTIYSGSTLALMHATDTDTGFLLGGSGQAYVMCDNTYVISAFPTALSIGVTTTVNGSLSVTDSISANAGKLLFQDAASNPTVAGNLWRNGADLVWHNGYSAAPIATETWVHDLGRKVIALTLKNYGEYWADGENVFLWRTPLWADGLRVKHVTVSVITADANNDWEVVWYSQNLAGSAVSFPAGTTSKDLGVAPLLQQGEFVYIKLNRTTGTTGAPEGLSVVITMQENWL